MSHGVNYHRMVPIATGLMPSPPGVVTVVGSLPPGPHSSNLVSMTMGDNLRTNPAVGVPLEASPCDGSPTCPPAYLPRCLSPSSWAPRASSVFIAPVLRQAKKGATLTAASLSSTNVRPLPRPRPGLVRHAPRRRTGAFVLHRQASLVIISLPCAVALLSCIGLLRKNPAHLNTCFLASARRRAFAVLK